MLNRETAILLLVVALASAARISLANEISDDLKIREVRAKSNEYIAQHDAAGIASFLDDDYQITTGKGEFFRETPQEDAAAWAEIFDTYADVVYIRTPESVEVSSYLPLAYEAGSWVGSWTAAGGRKEVGGRYSASWHKVAGKWKIRSELFVTLYCNGPAC